MKGNKGPTRASLFLLLEQSQEVRFFGKFCILLFLLTPGFNYLFSNSFSRIICLDPVIKCFHIEKNAIPDFEVVFFSEAIR